MAPTTASEAADIQLQLTTHLLTRKDQSLSWPGWLTYSGWFTHISGHPSDTGRAQDSESTPAKDRCSTAGPRNQPITLNPFPKPLLSIVTSPARAVAQYCDVMSTSVCLSVREDISVTTRAIFTKFFVHVAYVRGSVVLRHVYDRPHRLSRGRDFLHI